MDLTETQSMETPAKQMLAVLKGVHKCKHFGKISVRRSNFTKLALFFIGEEVKKLK